VARILVGVDGSLTIEAKPEGLLGLEEDPVHLEGQDGRSVFEHVIAPPGGRQWRVITAT
jgi:hypothetical protein